MTNRAAQQVEGLFQGRGIMFGQELLVDWKTALEIVEICRERGVGILGLDFYKEDDFGITEIDCGGADFSEFFRFPDAAVLSIEAALRLIRNDLPDKADYVSFVLK